MSVYFGHRDKGVNTHALFSHYEIKKERERERERE